MEISEPMQTPEAIAFTREHLKQIAEVWIGLAKRKLEPYKDKVPAPLARLIKRAPPEGGESPDVPQAA